ncbi:MAG: HlyC/CorC family transporter [Deltaproteobacteria bacterium]|nr:HlyC/CorC family transporter [Deltaproteobacteria bacterium]MBW1952027.1 HlyC/CorC family transporter [Deltaproteobacteria bacterium]MBW1986091.1 HlyC/CorC family transporter [Deltaproteobacteria bacterium]MBW2134223.1 HlyC/CorC family transporter [Deltaproteobacteria bacterium]
MGFYGFFATAETSLFSLSPLIRLKLKEKSKPSGRLIETLLSRPQRLLTSIIIGNETVNILASVLATSLALDLWGPQGKWLALLVIVPAMLLFGEIIPKSIALTYPERLARLVALPLTVVLPLLTPFRVVLLRLSRSLMTILGCRPETQVTLVKEEDFLRMVEESHEAGLIAPLEREFILNLMAFGDITVGKIMVPRTDIFSLPINLPSADLIQAIKRSRFSRVPIYGQNREDILGILHAKDLLALSPGKQCDRACIKKLLRPPYYVPENKRAFDLLSELQVQKLRLCLVVDEYGSLAGLVSVEDLLEELFGEIEDEFQRSGKLLDQLAPGVYLVRSRLPVAEFNNTTGLDLPLEPSDTMGGFVFNLFGELPREGDVISYNGLEFEVLRMKGTRIIEILVSVVKP